MGWSLINCHYTLHDNLSNGSMMETDAYMQSAHYNGSKNTSTINGIVHHMTSAANVGAELHVKVTHLSCQHNISRSKCQGWAEVIGTITTVHNLLVRRCSTQGFQLLTL